MVSRKFKRLSVIVVFSFLIIFNSSCISQKNKCLIESCQIIDDTITIIIQHNGIRFGDFSEFSIGKYNFYDKSKIDEESLKEFSYELMFFNIDKSDSEIKITTDWSNQELKEKPEFVNGNLYTIYISSGPQHIQAETVYKEGVFVITKQHYTRAL